MLATFFSFSGRTGRLGYFTVALVQLAVLAIGFGVLLTTSPKGAAGFLAIILMFGASAWVGVAGMVRRIRDMGWPMVVSLVATFFVPGFSLLLLIWPSKPQDFDSAVFSDDDPPARKSRRKSEESGGPSWMQNALAQASSAKSAQPAPIPRVSATTAASAGPRTQFGLRRSYGQ